MFFLLIVLPTHSLFLKFSLPPSQSVIIFGTSSLSITVYHVFYLSVFSFHDLFLYFSVSLSLSISLSVSSSFVSLSLYGIFSLCFVLMRSLSLFLSIKLPIVYLSCSFSLFVPPSLILLVCPMFFVHFLS